tara:strand:+ start:184 stop:879 length:696 start_codon:yes stop_codon:yes gene_type:complete
MGTTNFPNGATNNTAQNSLGQMILQDPTKAHTYFNDFDTYLAGEWTATDVGAATQALTDEDGGVLLITNAAADNNSSFFNKVGESFLMEATKPAFFKARFKVSDAIESDFIIGLQITDTTPLVVTDGIYFRKDDADALLDFVVIKDSTATTSTGIATVADDTYLTVAFYYNGSDKISYYAGTDSNNPTFIGEAVTTNLPDDEELTISFGIQNGEAVAKTMSIDYIFASKER